MLVDGFYGLIGDDAAAVVALGATVAAGVLLWVLAARLSVSPAAGAAVLALYASAVLVVDVASGPGVDGTGVLLLAAAATLAVGGGVVRHGLAIALLVAAVGVIPVAAVGLILLLGAMAVPGALLHRLPRRARVAVGFGAVVPAAAVAFALARPAEPAALPPLVPAVLTLWGLLVAGVLWRRVTWLRPVCAALAGLVACLWIPGPDGDAVLVVVATSALLTAVAAEDISAVLARRVLVAVAASAVAGATVLLTPAVSGERPALLRPPAAAPGAAAVAPVRPVAVSIPALSVAGPLEELVADADTGELAAPADPARAGWYAAGVVPGDRGPAVIGGHVDSRSGPGVFFRLRTLRPGDLVDVTRSDGRTVRFSVIAVALYPKDRFPTEAVYGPTSGPELRLVTCGGTFDRSARSYDDNVVVDAALV
ncbi:MAG TPA: class F sortase [Pseudonocardia sp.]|nr:class F sortase [Pseudonocardia sp.]